jgi:hypothetical protein
MRCEIDAAAARRRLREVRATFPERNQTGVCIAKSGTLLLTRTDAALVAAGPTNVERGVREMVNPSARFPDRSRNS